MVKGLQTCHGNKGDSVYLHGVWVRCLGGVWGQCISIGNSMVNRHTERSLHRDQSLRLQILQGISGKLCPPTPLPLRSMATIEQCNLQELKEHPRSWEGGGRRGIGRQQARGKVWAQKGTETLAEVACSSRKAESRRDSVGTGRLLRSWGNGGFGLSCPVSD